MSLTPSAAPPTLRHPPGTATARNERVIVAAFGLIRLGTLAYTSASTSISWDSFVDPYAVVGLLVLSGVESGVVFGAARRRGTLFGPVLVALDASRAVVLLLAMNPLIRSSADPYTANVFYPYTVAAMALVGLGLRRLAGAVLVPAVPAGVYLGTTWWTFGFGSHTIAVQNSLTYWLYSVLGWTISRWYRGLGRDLDQARRETVAREVELIEERERNRHIEELRRVQTAAMRNELKLLREREETLRNLHDGVLQTLEFLKRDGLVSDSGIQGRVGQEAAWLRRLVSDEPARRYGLAATLSEVAAQQSGYGLEVELNLAGLGDESLSPLAVSAFSGAVREALTNVRKHAGVDRAVVWAGRSGDDVVVTVVDHGCGFDPDRVRWGAGLPQSVVARMCQARGNARIETAPDAGTRVELTLHQPTGPPAGPADE